MFDSTSERSIDAAIWTSDAFYLRENPCDVSITSACEELNYLKNKKIILSLRWDNLRKKDAACAYPLKPGERCSSLSMSKWKEVGKYEDVRFYNKVPVETDWNYSLKSHSRINFVRLHAGMYSRALVTRFLELKLTWFYAFCYIQRYSWHSSATFLEMKLNARSWCLSLIFDKVLSDQRCISNLSPTNVYFADAFMTPSYISILIDYRKQYET